MGREIKFRAQDIKTKEWRYGFYVYDEEWAKGYIYYVGKHSDKAFYQLQRYEIIPETVGQYTGLKDKNGKEIYEGDIVRWLDKKDSMNDEKIFHCGQIEWKDVYIGAHSQTYHLSYRQCRDIEYTEIIGNVFENKELLNET